MDRKTFAIAQKYDDQISDLDDLLAQAQHCLAQYDSLVKQDKTVAAGPGFYKINDLGNRFTRILIKDFPELREALQKMIDRLIDQSKDLTRKFEEL